jgi:AraC-like DNA-binding protein
MAKKSNKKSFRVPPIAATICELFEFLEDLQYWIKDRDGRYLWVNRGFLMNYALERREQVIGKTDYDLSPVHLADQYRLDDERVLKGEIISGRIELVGRFDHSACWSMTHKFALRDERGKICGTTGMSRKIGNSESRIDVHDAALGRVAALIRENCARDWTNRDLAKNCNLSLRAFERRFQATFQLTPHNYLRRMRVRLASHALVYSAAPLAQIAVEHGFADQSHFTREFSQEISMTPGTYRKRFGVSQVKSNGGPRRFTSKV